MIEAGPPHSDVAEASVVASLLGDPKTVPEVVGALLEPRHFFSPGYHLLFEEIVDSYYADDPLDSISVAQRCAKQLAVAWQLEEGDVVQRVTQLVERRKGVDGTVADHALLVRRYADYRALQELSLEVGRAVEAEDAAPDEIAAEASQTAMQIATSRVLTQEIISFEELGRRFVANQRRLMAARAQGIELGAYFGLPFVDNWVRGFQPTELWFLGGLPGAGKSALAWTAGYLFTRRQLRKPPEERVGAFVLSLEMGEKMSGARVAQTVGEMDGGSLREGKTTGDELRTLVDKWGEQKDLPLYFNHSSILRSTELLALVIEAIRKHNVGLIIIDHWRYLRMEGRFASKNEEDEEKVTFLKQRIAKDLNVAVICIAHVTKGSEQREGGRPKLSDLRGSGQISAEADIVSFVHRPWEYASDEQRASAQVSRTDAELIFEKNRQGLTGISRYYQDLSTMTIR